MYRALLLNPCSNFIVLKISRCAAMQRANVAAEMWGNTRFPAVMVHCRSSGTAGCVSIECFHFVVSQASPEAFLLLRFPGFLAERTLVSKVMDLPGPVPRLMRGQVYPDLSRRDTGWAGPWPSLPTRFCCVSPEDTAVPDLQSNLGLSSSQSCHREPRRDCSSSHFVLGY